MTLLCRLSLFAIFNIITFINFYVFFLDNYIHGICGRLDAFPCHLCVFLLGAFFSNIPEPGGNDDHDDDDDDMTRKMMMTVIKMMTRVMVIMKTT